MPTAVLAACAYHMHGALESHHSWLVDNCAYKVIIPNSITHNLITTKQERKRAESMECWSNR